MVRLKDGADLTVQAFRIWDFMGFEDSGWIELRPINLLFGRNSTGKSAILRALLLLRQSLTSPPSREPLTLSAEDGIDVGSFQHIVHHKTGSGDDELEQDKNNIIAFAFKCRIHPELLEIFQLEEKRLRAQAEEKPVVSDEEAWATLQLDFGPARASRRIVLQGLEIHAPWLNAQGEDTGTLIFGAEWLESETIDGVWFFESDLLKQHLDPTVEKNPWDSVEDFGIGAGFLPVLPELEIGGAKDDKFESDYDIVRKLLDEFRQVISDFLKSLHYLGPVRSKPQRFYYAPGAMSSRTSIKGMNVLDDLLATWGTNRWKRGLEQINTRLEELELGIQLKVRALDEERKPHQSLFEVVLQEQEGIEVTLCDTGFGWSQMLPIVVECALAEKGATIIIEEPEAHLHPGAQVTLGDLFVRVAKEGVRFLIETHSEHLLLRFRQRIARTALGCMKRSRGISVMADDANAPELAPGQLAVYFVEREAGVSYMEPIWIDEQGQYVKRPDGFKRFFSDDYEQVMLINRDIAELNRLEHNNAGND